MQYLGVFTIGMIALSKVPFRFLLGGLKPVFLIIIFTFALHILFTKEGELLYSFGWLEIYKGGLTQGLFISLRFTFLILVTSLLTLTTSPISITDGMEELVKSIEKMEGSCP